MNEMTILNEDQQYELMKKQAGAFFKSGLFPDLKFYEQAVTKVMIGKELGVGPFASIRGIYVSANGSLELKASLISSIISNHPRYSYHIKTSTKEICEIDFYDSEFGKDPIGTSSFTITEAQQAGLLNKDPKYNPWIKYPSDMLFNRALSRGARRFAPGAFAGIPVYVSGETKETPLENNVLHLKQVATLNISDDGLRAIPVTNSDEAIIEEFKQTHAISEGGI